LWFHITNAVISAGQKMKSQDSSVGTVTRLYVGWISTWLLTGKWVFPLLWYVGSCSEIDPSSCSMGMRALYLGVKLAGCEVELYLYAAYTPSWCVQGHTETVNSLGQ